jgi:hypothetical protein
MRYTTCGRGSPGLSRSSEEGMVRERCRAAEEASSGSEEGGRGEEAGVKGAAPSVRWRERRGVGEAIASKLC